MGPPGSRKRIHTSKKKFFKKNTLSVKNRSKDVDQIRDELAKRQRTSEEDMEIQKEPEEVEFDPDLPGGGRFYCTETARHFISQDALDKHKKSKQFKQRVKVLRNETNYTQDSSESSLGISKEVLPPV